MFKLNKVASILQIWFKLLDNTDVSVQSNAFSSVVGN